MERIQTAVIAPAALEQLVVTLARRGYRVLGPTARDGAIVLDDIESADELPIGRTAVQEAGRYRLTTRADQARFGYAVGPHAFKQFLFPPRLLLWRARRDGDEGLTIDEPEPGDERPLALIGVRGCDLHAIAIQDRVFLDGRYVERDYQARRSTAFIVAVDCHEPAATCFCGSMATGPGVDRGYDLALSELLEGEHRLLVRAGSARGAEVLAELPQRAAEDDDVRAATAAVERAAAAMGRAVDTDDLEGLLARNLEHERFDDVATRCLQCGNCTMVCPTCFCTAIEDGADLAGTQAERVRRWDSCFSSEHSFLGGGSVRTTPRSRYRQWLSHKFGTWQEQFGTAGCVGCGRCITWCPVGIDVTEELAALRAAEGLDDAHG